jgi:hypothetical protein
VIWATGMRANFFAQIDQTGLFEIVHSNFADLLFANGTRKAYLMLRIDHDIKMFFGCRVVRNSKTCSSFFYCL